MGSSIEDCYLEIDPIGDGINLEADKRPPSVLKQLLQYPVDNKPFYNEPALPASFGSNNWKLIDWLKAVDSLYFNDKLCYCVLMYALSNGGSFSIDSIPKSFKHKDLPKKMEEDDWIRSFQYVAKMMELERAFLYHDQIKDATAKLSTADNYAKEPFLSQSDEKEFSFLNELIGDAVALSYSGRRIERALQFTKPVFLYRYCMTNSQMYDLADYDDRRIAVSISPGYAQDMIFNKFIEEACKGHLINTLGNRMFDNEIFCSSFLEYLKNKKQKDIQQNLFNAIDVSSTTKRPKSFLYCIVVQEPPKRFLFEPILALMTLHCNNDFMKPQLVMTAEYCCRRGLVEFYLKLSPNINTLPFCFIPSTIASRDSVLLDRVLSHQSWTQGQLDKAMQWIATTGKFEDYLRVKQQGARPDGLTLYESVIGKNNEMVEDVLREGVDCDIDIFNGRKVIHAAAEVGSLDIINLILQSGADIESRSDKGELPLHIAIDNSHEELAEHLLMRGADPSQRDYRGATALLRACANGLYRLIERLMYIGVDVMDKDDQGCNILHKAYLSGEIEVIQFSKSHKMTVDVTDNNKNSVLHFSAMSGNLKQFESLLDQMPSSISACNAFNWNPATCAAMCGRRDIFLFLKRNGSNLQQMTNEGETILDLACRGKKLRESRRTAFITPFQEAIKMGSLEEYEDIIKSFTI